MAELSVVEARTLLARIRGETIPVETVLQPELLVRASTGPAPG